MHSPNRKHYVLKITLRSEDSMEQTQLEVSMSSHCIENIDLNTLGWGHFQFM